MTSSSSGFHELERALSEVALALFAPATVAGTLQQIVDLAVRSIDGCDAAGILIVTDGTAATAAASGRLAVELDQLQVDVGEGPCLAASEGGTGVYASDMADDPRWPAFGPRALAAGVRSMLAYSLGPPHRLERPSALNLYARLPAAFGATDRAQGQLFATLARLSLDTAEERASDEQRIGNLHLALGTRELIGQAQGILMERERITADQAFDVLRRASQHVNIKLREVAATLVETGEAPETGSRSAAQRP